MVNKVQLLIATEACIFVVSVHKLTLLSVF